MEQPSNQNNLFPLFLKLEKFNILLVGAGSVASDKLSVLLTNSPKAKIKVVALEVNIDIESIAISYPNVELNKRAFKNSDLDGIDVMILATNNKSLNADIYKLGREHGILTNVVDTPDLCDFYFSSIVSKKDLKIAISTNGKSPIVAKRLRQYFEECIPDEIADSIEHLHELRDKIRGDLAQKAKVLNELTQILISKEKEEQQTK